MSHLLPVGDDSPSQFILTDSALEMGGPTEMLQVFVEFAPERGWMQLKAHLVFWNTVAVCLRRVGAGDDTAITLARSIEAAVEKGNEAYFGRRP